MVKLGEQIKRMRIKKGITQGELAASVGSTISSISNYERGRRTPPYPVLYAIAEALEAPLQEFMPLTVSGENDAESTSGRKFSDRRPRRIKRLMAAFDSLSEDAQLKAVECVEGFARIPVFRRTLPGILQQYICSRYDTGCIMLEDTGIPNPFKEGAVPGGAGHAKNVRNIVFYCERDKKTIEYWNCICYTADESHGGSADGCSAGQPVSADPMHHTVFVFFNSEIMDRVYDAYDNKQEPFSTRPDYMPLGAGIHPEFLLLDKETLEIKEARCAVEPGMIQECQMKLAHSVQQHINKNFNRKTDIEQGPLEYDSCRVSEGEFEGRECHWAVKHITFRECTENKYAWCWKCHYFSFSQSDVKLINEHVVVEILKRVDEFGDQDTANVFVFDSEDAFDEFYYCYCNHYEDPCFEYVGELDCTFYDLFLLIDKDTWAIMQEKEYGP